MRNYELHYAELGLTTDIPLINFKSFNELVDFVCKKSEINKGNAVYLIAKDFYTTCPFITDNPFDIEPILLRMPSMGFSSATFVQEYKSFEEAYEVALTMVETKSLAYS